MIHSISIDEKSAEILEFVKHKLKAQGMKSPNANHAIEFLAEKAGLSVEEKPLNSELRKSNDEFLWE
mgnify:CR=1 FL=1